MTKDELKEKAANLKERVKESYADNKKKAEGLIDRMRETVRDRVGKAKRDVSHVDDDE